MLGIAGYMTADSLAASVLTCYYRWFQDGIREHIGGHIVAVDYPWWIDHSEKDGVELYNIRATSPSRITAVRLLWDPQHHIHLDAGKEELESTSEYTVFRRVGGIAKRIHNDFVIIVSCGQVLQSCIEQMPEIEGAIRIRAIERPTARPRG